MDAKASWRDRLRAVRRQVVAEQGELGRAAHAARLAEHVMTLARELAGGGALDGLVVTAYQELRTEPPVSAAVSALREAGATVLLPITLERGRLDWHDAADPEARPLGPTALDRVTLVLAPALAVDRTGRRLGKGGGYYDHTLPALRRRHVPVVAVLHDGEVVDQLPALPHDVAVDAALTAADGVRWLRDRASG